MARRMAREDEVGGGGQHFEAQAFPVVDEAPVERLRLEPLGNGGETTVLLHQPHPGHVPVAAVRQGHHGATAGVDDGDAVGERQRLLAVVRHVHRRDADALLQRVTEAAKTRARLKIFFGFAPGVGKTFAMLGEGHRRKERGTDVVVAFVEDHGRARTRELVEGLEVVPRQQVEHRGAAFTEMDLEGVLRRRPSVALVDELAHTNVPGSAHEKRWQDVEALLDAGIEVVTTVNVQHLESLNDVTQQITGVRQRETVFASPGRQASITAAVNKKPLDFKKPKDWLRFAAFFVAFFLGKKKIFFNLII